MLLTKLLNLFRRTPVRTTSKPMATVRHRPPRSAAMRRILALDVGEKLAFPLDQAKNCYGMTSRANKRSPDSRFKTTKSGTCVFIERVE